MQYQLPTQSPFGFTNINQQAFLPVGAGIRNTLPMINTMPQFITSNGTNIGQIGQPELVL